MRRLMLLFGSAFCLMGCDDTAMNETVPVDRDNTAVNKRDADGATKTPFDQSNSSADTELVAKIRSRVLEIEDLSISGQNIKIITNDGKVQLRGPVVSDAEHDAILTVVNDIAGAANVTDQLEIDRE